MGLPPAFCPLPCPEGAGQEFEDNLRKLDISFTYWNEQMRCRKKILTESGSHFVFLEESGKSPGLYCWNPRSSEYPPNSSRYKIKTHF